MTLSKGQSVRQIVPIITGTIIAKKFNDDTDQFEFCVAYTDADGHPSERWFTESEIEADPVADPAAQ